jgi:hypothetical protein
MFRVYFRIILYYEIIGPFGQKVVRNKSTDWFTLEGDNVRYLFINLSFMVEFCEFRLLIESEIKFGLTNWGYTLNT